MACVLDLREADLRIHCHGGTVTSFPDALSAQAKPPTHAGLPLCECTSFILCAQRFEAGDKVEQFLVDATLTQTMKGPVKLLQ